jgi:hypothetical protein
MKNKFIVWFINWLLRNHYSIFEGTNNGPVDPGGKDLILGCLENIYCEKVITVEGYKEIILRRTDKTYRK